MATAEAVRKPSSRDDADGKVRIKDLIGAIKSTRNVNELKKKLLPTLPSAKKSGLKRSKKASEVVKDGKSGKRPQLSKGVEGQTGKRRPSKEFPIEEGSSTIATKVKKKINKAEEDTTAVETKPRKRGPLAVPLHRQAARRIESEIAYAESRQELHQWNKVIFDNRVAEQICFPLGDPRWKKVETAEEKARQWEPRTQLERQTAEVLAGSKYNLRNAEPYCEAEKEIIRAMSLREARKRCAELQNRRALMSYKAAKMRHDARIKSKGYHRRLKRAKRHQMIKEIEKLVEVDPEKAKEKLQQINTDRILERATLKHSGGSSWSRHIGKYASKDPKLRQLLDDQLRLGREAKSKGEGRDDGEDPLDALWDQIEAEAEPDTATDMGSWSAKAEIVSKLEGNAEQKAKMVKYQPATLSSTSIPLSSATKGGTTVATNSSSSAALDLSTGENAPILKLPAREILRVPDELMAATTEAEDGELQQLQFLAEAYEDDDVVGDFRARKQRVEKEEEPATADFNLYGWGSWTGPGIVDKKRESLIIKPRTTKRKDAHHRGVIIREKISEGVAKLQPRDVPFPFTSVRDYEIAIQQPLGREWNSPLAQEALLRPRVVTKAGRIIRPMDRREKLKVVKTAEMRRGRKEGAEEDEDSELEE